jgi:hypothetical protein
MSHINRQLAPGFGDILPGNFVLPQNPFTHPLAGVRVPHLAELLPAKFAIPENPLLNALQGKTMPGQGCGCGMGRGMGQLDLSNLGTTISTWFSSVPWTVWAAGGAAVLLLLYMSGGGRPGYRAARRETIEGLKRKYPTRAGRVQRAVATYGQ